MAAPAPQRDVDRELARARGARRLLPWAFLSALAGGAIAWVAGGGPRGAASLFALGLVFSLYLWTTSIARCPACGASLRATERPEACRGCGVRF
jgi:hypothetical protein